MLSTFGFPNRIVFGPGIVEQLPDLLEEHGATSILLVTDKGLLEAGIAGRIETLARGTAAVSTFDDVAPNPHLACVEAAAKQLANAAANIVIGLGGGSAMDTAKAAALRLNHHRPMTDYEIQADGHCHMTEAVPPIIAIPTTAGTGSEVGRSAVITLPDENRKAVICGPKLLPSVAVCDPELTVGLPPAITAATGMDALTHNVEAYLSTCYHPICDAVALGGIRLASRNLAKAVHQGDDLEARGNMMLASSMGAIAFQKDLGVAHALAHPLSSLAGVPHGLANAIVLPHAMTFNLPAAAVRLQDVAEALGCPIEGLSAEEAGETGIKAVTDLNKRVDLPTRLSDVGVTEALIPALADLALADPNHTTNPRSCTRSDFVDLYHLAL